jgi:hypothetical protein
MRLAAACAGTFIAIRLAAIAAAAIALSTCLAPAHAEEPNLTQQQVDWCLNDKDAFSPDQQIAGCTAMLGIRPDSARTLYRRGIALLLRGDLQIGDADITRAMEIDPDASIPGVTSAETGYLISRADAKRKSVPVTVEIRTAGAIIFVFTPGHAHPVRFDGADSTKDVPLNAGRWLVVAVPRSAEWRLGTRPQQNP